MQRKKETRPSRQANGRATQESNHMVAQTRADWRGLNAYYAFLGAVVLYGVLIFLHDMNII